MRNHEAGSAVSNVMCAPCGNIAQRDVVCSITQGEAATTLTKGFDFFVTRSMMDGKMITELPGKRMSGSVNSDIRWQQRFDNFDRAFVLFREVYDRGVDSLSQLEKEGALQRFEVAFELAWKTLKDYLEENGIVVNPVTPRNVIKEAFAAKLLDDAPVWIDMMLHRNLLSHTYDSAVFETVLRAAIERYFPAFERLHEFLLLKKIES